VKYTIVQAHHIESFFNLLFLKYYINKLGGTNITKEDGISYLTNNNKNKKKNPRGIRNKSGLMEKNPSPNSARDSA